MPNGVDTDLFRPKHPHDSSEDKLNIGYVGQLHTYGIEKGITFSLSALDAAINELKNSSQSEYIYKNIIFTVMIIFVFS